MTNKSIEFDDAGADWAALSSRLRAIEPDSEVSEFDVARLRRSVAASLGDRRANRQHGMARLAVAAVAVIVGGLGLYTALDGSRVEPASGVQVAMTADGNVAIRFHDAKEHRITKSDEPVPGPTAETAIARGRTFVDRDATPKPGEVTFYRID